jgi:hypothetical protein
LYCFPEVVDLDWVFAVVSCCALHEVNVMIERISVVKMLVLMVCFF